MAARSRWRVRGGEQATQERVSGRVGSREGTNKGVEVNTMMKRTHVKRVGCDCESAPFCEHASNAKTTGHTPGPWRVKGPNHDVVCSKHGLLAATRYLGNSVEAEAEHLANARLIAAVPVLLDELVLALPYIESELNNPAYKAGVIAARVKAIRAAINLATKGEK
jgi:hypothetical protein